MCLCTKECAEMAVHNFHDERSGFFGSRPLDTNGHFSNFNANGDMTFNGSVTSGVTLNGLAWMIYAQQTCCDNILTENKKLGETVASLQDTVSKLQTNMQEIHTWIRTDKGGTPPPKARLPGTLTVAVKRLHQSLENQFDGTKLFSDKYNQEVAEVLTTKLTNEFEEDEKIDL